MQLPQGCGGLSGMLVKLNKSLDGLKQLSRQCHAMLKTECLSGLGFEQCSGDACFFRLVESGRVMLILVVHANDIFAAGMRESLQVCCLIKI